MELCCSSLTSHARASTSGGGAGSSGGGAGGGGSGGGAAREALLINCMLCLLGVLGCDAYHGRISSLGGRDAAAAERTKALAAAVHASLEAFWASPADGGGGAPRRVALLTALVEGLFPLTARELAEWEEDAEAWHHAAEGGAWEDGLRPCGEHLFLQLLTVRLWGRVQGGRSRGGGETGWRAARPAGWAARAPSFSLSHRAACSLARPTCPRRSTGTRSRRWWCHCSTPPRPRARPPPPRRPSPCAARASAACRRRCSPKRLRTRRRRWGRMSFTTAWTSPPGSGARCCRWGAPGGWGGAVAQGTGHGAPSGRGGAAASARPGLQNGGGPDVPAPALPGAAHRSCRSPRPPLARCAAPPCAPSARGCRVSSRATGPPRTPRLPARLAAVTPRCGSPPSPRCARSWTTSVSRRSSSCPASAACCRGWRRCWWNRTSSTRRRRSAGRGGGAPAATAQQQRGAAGATAAA
jgi:hypothetical protein